MSGFPNKKNFLEEKIRIKGTEEEDKKAVKDRRKVATLYQTDRTVASMTNAFCPICEEEYLSRSTRRVDTLSQM